MYNVETGRCEDKPKFRGVARVEGITKSEIREMNITLSEYRLTVCLRLYHVGRATLTRQCQIEVKVEGNVTWTMGFGFSPSDYVGSVYLTCVNETITQ